MSFKNLGGELSRDYQSAPEDEALLADLLAMAQARLPREFDQLAFSIGIEEWIRAVFACNQYVDAMAPWALRKTDPERKRAVLMTLFRAVRTSALAIRTVAWQMVRSGKGAVVRVVPGGGGNM